MQSINRKQDLKLYFKFTGIAKVLDMAKYSLRINLGRQNCIKHM